MFEKDLKFLEDAFKQYYFDHFNLINVPNRASEREFGYKKFNTGMIRHISLKTDKDLHLMLMSNIPSDVFCSNAYYTFPSMPMSEKDWKEADIIFDIDAKDLKLPCRKDHTCLKCTSCNEIFMSQDSCPNCKSNKIEHISLPCDTCMAGLKKELSKLDKVLTDDLNIPASDIVTSFSGNEGFHLYVKPSASFPEFDESSWKGRVAKELFGSKSKKSKLVSKIISDGYVAYREKLNEMGKNSIGVKIDPNVTVDIHRIFRLEGSLNSKSGLCKLVCKDIEKAQPYTEACLIDDKPTEIIANCPIKFQLKNKKFGPYNGEKTSVPKYAAVYMMCKGIANSV